MTVTDAVKGLKHVIQHREQFIKGLDNLSKDWSDDSAKQMVQAVQDFVTKDIGAFEWILGELQDKKNSK